MVTPQNIGVAPRKRRARSQSELNLGYLRKFMRRLTAETGVNTSQEMRLALGTKIIAHINLARHNLLPQTLAQTSGDAAKSPSFQLFEHLQQKYFDGAVFVDDSRLASVLTEPLAITAADLEANGIASVRSLTDTIDSLIAQVFEYSRGDNQAECRLEAMAGNILAVGWAHESLLQLDKKGNTTQVFTPQPVAEDIARDILPDADNLPGTILDPACGAGHLLVVAAERWLQLAKTNAMAARGDAADDVGIEDCISLQKLFGEKLFGLDIDENLLTLCGFSLYLLAADHLDNNTEMLKTIPLPNLFKVESEFGSLVLGAKPARNRERAVEPLANSRGRLINLEGEQLPLTALPGTFDSIVMNPPYLSTRIMGGALSQFLKNYYEQSAGDLYTAFIDLAMRLLNSGGRLSTIVQQSFLSIQRYRQFRLSLIDVCHIVSCINLGAGTFSARSGEKVNSVILTLEKKDSDRTNVTNLVPPRSIVYANTADGTTGKISEAAALEIVGAISGNPFAFDCLPALAALFKNTVGLGDAKNIEIVNGLFTCNNKLFVSEASAVARLPESEKALYVPYDKGGGQKWYHQTKLCLRWVEGGKEIQDYRKTRGQSRSLPGGEFYFKPGITYSYIGTSGFRARLLSDRSVFDIASSALFTREDEDSKLLLYLLGFLNSALSIYLLSVLNPTINFQIGDLRRLPFVKPDANSMSRISVLSQSAVDLIKQTVENREQLSTERLLAITKQEALLQTEIDNIIFEIYNIDTETRRHVTANQWVRNSRKKLLK